MWYTLVSVVTGCSLEYLISRRLWTRCSRARLWPVWDWTMWWKRGLWRKPRWTWRNHVGCHDYGRVNNTTKRNCIFSLQLSNSFFKISHITVIGASSSAPALLSIGWYEGRKHTGTKASMCIREFVTLDICWTQIKIAVMSKDIDPVTQPEANWILEGKTRVPDLNILS